MKGAPPWFPDWARRLLRRPPEMLCVLGMHRSGTSCLTGLLEEAGIFLGVVSKSNPHNKKGNQENLRIMALNDALLESNGASWDLPPAGPLAFTPAQVQTIRDLIATEYQGHSPWAFKDPRTLLTLEAWLAALPRPAFIGTFRHPLAVASSLSKRQGWELARGIDLWCHYNRRLLGFHDQFGFPLLDFDLPPPAYAQHFRAALRTLGLGEGPAELAFYDTTLVNHRSPPEDAIIPALALDILADLKRRAG